jgi:hypothetical protein
MSCHRNLTRLNNKPASLAQRHDLSLSIIEKSYLKVNFDNVMNGEGRAKTCSSQGADDFGHRDNDRLNARNMRRQVNRVLG